MPFGTFRQYVRGTGPGRRRGNVSVTGKPNPTSRSGGGGGASGLRIYNRNGNGTYITLLRAAGMPLVTPSDLAAPNPTSSAVSLTWSDVNGGLAYYWIERSTDNGATWPLYFATATAATSYTDSTVAASTSYLYRIRARENSPRNAWSDPAAAQPVGATTPALSVPAPTGFTITVAGNTQISLAWTDNSGGVATYHVERAPDVGGSAGSWIDLTTATAAGATSYNDTTCVAGTTYWYQIRAEEGVTVSAWVAPTPTHATTTGGSVPSAPSGLSILQMAGNGFALKATWLDNSGNETLFRLQRSTDGVNFVDAATTGPSSGTGLTVSTVDWLPLAPNTTYTYRVRAENGSGNSAWSATAAGTTASVPTSQTRYVDPVLGSDVPANGGSAGAGAWKTIAYAASQVSAGTLVSCAAGTYSEMTLTIANAGASTTRIVFQSATLHGAVLTQPNANNLNLGLVLSGSWITFDGFDVTGAGKDGVKSTGTNNTLTNCRTYTNGWGQSYVNAVVTTVTVTNGGSGYTSAPTVVFPQAGAAGSGTDNTIAQATATISGGSVTAVTITRGGDSYVSPPTISFSGGGGGSGAQATATIGIPATAITGGSGYTSAPTVTASDGSVWTPVINGGAVVRIDFVSMVRGQTSRPTLTWNNAGTGGSGAAVNYSGLGTNVLQLAPDTFGGSGILSLTTSVSSNLTVSNCQSYSNREHGLYVSEGNSGIVLTDLQLYSNGQPDRTLGGVGLHCNATGGNTATTGWIFERLLIYGNLNSAWDTQWMQNGVLRNSVLYGPSAIGNGSTGNLFAATTFYSDTFTAAALNQNTNPPLKFTKSTKGNSSGNSYQGCIVGNACTGGLGHCVEFDLGSEPATTCDYNLFYSNRLGSAGSLFYEDLAPTKGYTLTQLQNGQGFNSPTAQDVHSVYGAPTFLNLTGDDLRLASGSNGVGTSVDIALIAGETTGADKLDRDGFARPGSQGYDVGGYQRAAS